MEKSNMKQIGFLHFIFCLLLLLSFITIAACADDDDDDNDNDTVDDDDNDTTDDDTSDDDDDNDISAKVNGWLTDYPNAVYSVTNGVVNTIPLQYFNGTVFIITQHENIFYFCDEGETPNYISIWRYDGLFTETVVFDDPWDECTYHPHSLAYFGPDIEDYLLLLRIRTDDPEMTTIYEYLGDNDPGVDPVGLFAGFTGGAYPFDDTTVYVFDGADATPITTIPEGTIVAAKAWKENGLLALTDDNALWTWDAENGWNEVLAQYVEAEQNAFFTDPEGDILVGELVDVGTVEEDYYAYYEIADGALVPYTAFDVSACPLRTTALAEQSAKVFWCDSKPTYLECDETAGTDSYFIIEQNGAIQCRGTGHFNWATFIAW